jgi:hypothetical protein
MMFPWNDILNLEKGAMFWSLDSDKLGAESLVGVSAEVLGGLDQTQVCLDKSEICAHSKARETESLEVG